MEIYTKKDECQRPIQARHHHRPQNKHLRVSLDDDCAVNVISIPPPTFFFIIAAGHFSY